MTQTFIHNANIVHNNKFDYSRSKYVDNKTPVIIICIDCEREFNQTPALHIRGSGCKSCANRQLSQTKLKNKEHFIEKARGVHGEKFDYSKVIYTGVYNKVTIICPNGHEFNI
jgi:hypothetical protein